MITLSRSLAALTISSMALGAAPLRAQDNDKRIVVLNGCVAKGTSGGYLLTDVVAVTPAELLPPPADAKGPARYWLNSKDALSDREGKRVEVSGVVDFSDEHKGQVKITVDPSKDKDTRTEIKADGKKVTVKTDALPKMKGAGKASTTLEDQYFYDLHVVSVKTLGDCGHSARR